MAIVGLFTNIGISKAIEAQNNQGFKIFPTGFGVSDQKTVPFDETITTPNAGLWFQGLISSRVVTSPNTIKFVCTVPPGVIPPNTFKLIQEVYLFGVDTMSNQFMFAAGQPTVSIVYDPDGSVTLDLEVSLTNVPITDKVIFQFTQATEVSEHNTDPNAHPDTIEAINLAGIFQDAGGVAFEYMGQDFDSKAEFAGVKATAAPYSGTTYSAVRRGTLGNSITLTFDGIKTVNQIVTEWNNANPQNTVTFTPSLNGTSIPPNGAVSLGGGSYAAGIAQWAPVYKDVDQLYKAALDDGTIKSKVAGVADLKNNCVRGGAGAWIGGAITPYTSGQPAGTDLWLSATTPGAVQTVSTSTKVAVVLDANTVKLAGFGSGSGGGVSSDFDAVVTDTPGFHFYPTTQQAIAATPDGGRILVDKYESVTAQLDTLGKQLAFVFHGPARGWRRYTGSQAQQLISFSLVPDSGTWRIEWNLQESPDLAYNCTALDVENAFNAFTGHAGVVVTGNFTSGFLITYNGLNNYPLPTFVGAGFNEIQRFNLSGVPDNGTIQFQFQGDNTIHIAWNDSTADIEVDFEALPSIQDVTVTGGFSSSFIQVEFVGVDGHQDKPVITVIDNSLQTGITPVTPTFVQVQEGQYPASNLKNGVTPVNITAINTQAGSPVGPPTCIQLGADGTTFEGLGTISGFDVGIDLDGFVDTDIEMVFDANIQPILSTGLRPGVDFTDILSFGLLRQVIRTVGANGDYADIGLAYTDANDGDQILVLEDQPIAAGVVWTKEVEFLFANGSRLIPSVNFSGAVVTLGSKVRTKNLWLLLMVAGTWDQAFKFQGERGHHQNLQLECSGGSVIVTDGFRIDSGAQTNYIEGALLIGTATVTNIINNLSGVSSHNVQIRDKDNGTLHDLLNRNPPIGEVMTGTVDGINGTFTLSTPPSDQTAILVLVDGIGRTRGVHWNFVGPQTVQFTAGNEPQLGQSPEAYFTPTNLLFPSPNGRATPLEITDDNAFVETNVYHMDAGSGMTATQTAPGVVRLDILPGGGAGTWTNEYHTLTAPEVLSKAFTMANTPVDSNAVALDVLGDGAQEQGPSGTADYIVTGNVVSWAGLGMDTIGLVAGTRIRLLYFR